MSDEMDDRPWHRLTRVEQIEAYEAMEACGFPFEAYPGGPTHPDAPPITVEVFDAEGRLVESATHWPQYADMPEERRRKP